MIWYATSSSKRRVWLARLHSNLLAILAMDLHFQPRYGIKVFLDYCHKLCDLLDDYRLTLLKFSRKACLKEIISWDTRHEIKHKVRLGSSGAVVLLNSIVEMVERKPDCIYVVFSIMMKRRRLKNITENMRKEVWRIEE